LFEGIARAHRADSLVDVAAYSYGADDGSQARKNIAARLGDPADGGTFFDIAAMSHDDAVRTVCDHGPDVIFDMQGYTLGTRPQLMAARCAGVQASFLAFPGTSGASYLDYVVVDRHVSAVERAEEEFTEKLAVLPRPYQANYFAEPAEIPVRGSNEWKEMRANEGLSPSAFVFANFNKQDKIDPASFSSMMRCLQRVPESVLWLLAPSRPAAADVVKKNLLRGAAEAGIAPARLVFADKVGRAEHLRRMAAGDLFLDTFWYGAHTTATDALRGGMALLTLAGDSFARRVGTSLLHGMNANRAPALVTYSVQEFEDVAVEVATAQRDTEESISAKFIEPDDETEPDNQRSNVLFDWKSYARDLDNLSLMMLEVKHLTSKNMHIVLTKE